MWWRYLHVSPFLLYIFLVTLHQFRPHSCRLQHSQDACTHTAKRVWLPVLLNPLNSSTSCKTQQHMLKFFWQCNHKTVWHSAAQRSQTTHASVYLRKCRKKGNYIWLDLWEPCQVNWIRSPICSPSEERKERERRARKGRSDSRGKKRDWYSFKFLYCPLSLPKKNNTSTQDATFLTLFSKI